MSRRLTRLSKIAQPTYRMNLKTTTTPSSRRSKKMPSQLTVITRRRPLLPQSRRMVFRKIISCLSINLNFLQATKSSKPPSLPVVHLPECPAPTSPKFSRLLSSRGRVSPSTETMRRSKSLVKLQLPQLPLVQTMIRVIVRVVAPVPEQGVEALLSPTLLLLSPKIRSILSRKEGRLSLHRMPILVLQKDRCRRKMASPLPLFSSSSRITKMLILLLGC
mmetsp:Transcript_29875/g.87208  ORF Transcript_29875/g.87208 Transcript_29875/m.87208 type:complete len:219 (-) Transcript_29875:615-1271(-)